VVKDVQKALVGMEKKNEEMRDIADKQIKDNKASSQQSKLKVIDR
jgi:hypothetical protein